MGTGHHASPKTVARVLLIGDSTACTMVPGLEAVGAQAGVRIENGAVIGCGVVSGSVASTITDVVNPGDTSPTCQSRANAAEARALRAGAPNVVLWSSSWERSPLVVGSGDHQHVLAAGSRQWYDVLEKRVQQRVRRFTSAGATVVMLTQPAFYESGNPTGPTPNDETFVRLNAFLTRIRGKNPARQDRRSRSLRLPFWTAVSDPGRRHRAARGWGALLARGLALGRPLAHASDRDPGPREEGHHASEDRNPCTEERSHPRRHLCAHRSGGVQLRILQSRISKSRATRCTTT